MTIQEAIKVLTEHLESDEGYRLGWQANIAMSFVDAWDAYKRRTGKKNITQIDRHAIANEAADTFLKRLCS